MADINDHLVLVSGESTTGKSASLMNLKDPDGVFYLNTESGKRLPFKAKFRKGPDGKPGFVVTDPKQVYEAFDAAEGMDGIHTIVVDSLTYLMDMYESMYVIPAPDSRKAWGEFAQFFKNLMQLYVARSTKNVIFLAHTLSTHNEEKMIMETAVPVKGALKNQGIESYFSCVISTKRVSIKDLEGYENDLLTITPEEETLGYKYVFQTKVTKATVGERIRGPMGLWSTAETFIDNDIQLVMDRLHEFYEDDEEVAAA